MAGWVASWLVFHTHTLNLLIAYLTIILYGTPHMAGFDTTFIFEQTCTRLGNVEPEIDLTCVY